MSAADAPPLMRESSAQLRPDSSRVYADLFMPGEEMPGDHSRATAVINRVLALDRAQVSESLAGLRARFGDRPSLEGTFQHHFDTVAHRLGGQAVPSAEYQLLIGAYFTHDVSPEGAALTNPSMVTHPDQTAAEAGQLRFILSARAIGEGHISSAEFRTGTITDRGQVRFDTIGHHLETGQRQPTTYRREALWALLGEAGAAGETARLVLDSLGDHFDRAALEDAIVRIGTHLLTREASVATMTALRSAADNNYTVAFAPQSEISERILIPTGPTESNGIEDLRMVRFTDSDGSVSYLAPYTAYDGRYLTPQLLQTYDFETFTAQQLCGAAAKNKGMALFPRPIEGRRACLSRWDRERSFLAWSEDGLMWESAVAIQGPGRPDDLIQVGNCGSPLETAEGWLVLTHGVGPMRTYTIGAMLLQLDDPTRVIGTLPTPLIAPHGKESWGYVPNVVYTCGGLIHGDLLVVPYGYGDQAISVAVMDVPDLLARLTG